MELEHYIVKFSVIVVSDLCCFGTVGDTVGEGSGGGRNSAS